MSIFTKNCDKIFEPIINLSSMFRCIYRYQKWIPDKILHRNDNSIFFSTLFFFDKKNVFENEKIFFWKFSKFSKNQIFFKGKIWFSFSDFRKFSNFQKFPELVFYFTRKHPRNRVARRAICVDELQIC